MDISTNYSVGDTVYFLSNTMKDIIVEKKIIDSIKITVEKNSTEIYYIFDNNGYKVEIKEEEVFGTKNDLKTYIDNKIDSA